MAKKNKTLLYVILIVTILAFVYVSVPMGTGSLFALTGNVLSTNLVPNPSFETLTNGVPNSWSFNGADATHTIVVDSTNSHSGTNSVKMTVTNSTKVWFNPRLINNVNVVAGKYYLVEFWAKTSNLPQGTGTWTGVGGYPDRFDLEFREYYANNSQVPNYRGVIVVDADWNAARNTGWTKYQGYYKVQPGATSMSVAMYFYTTNGILWIDDLRISELEDLSTNVIGNPSFEIWNKPYYYDSTLNGNATRYDQSLGWYCGQFGGICERTTNSFDGQYAFKVTSPHSKTTYVAQEANYLKVGTKYSVSAYIKSADKVFFHAQRTNWSIGGDSGSVWYNGGDTWQKMTINFVPTKSSTHRLVIETMQNKPGTSFIVDKIEIKENGLATACTQLSNCGSTETCTNGFCMPLVCVDGYHAENGLCIKNPINCEVGSSYNAQTETCVKNPVSLFTSKLLMQGGLAILAGFMIFLIFKKK